MTVYKNKTNCVLCTSNQLNEIVRFQKTPIANRLMSENEKHENQIRIPLSLVMCSSCAHVQIRELVSPELLFSNYPYLSSTNRMMRTRLELLARKLTSKFRYKHEAPIKVLKIGSNDGYLLNELKKGGLRARKISVEFLEDCRQCHLGSILVYFSCRP